MPSKNRHVQQAEKNERFFRDFDWARTEFTDWVVVGMFYSALHYVEAVLATKNVHPRTHETRDPYVAKLAELKPVHVNYRELKDRSEDARYLGRRFSPSEVNTLDTDEYAALKAHIKPTR